MLIVYTLRDNNRYSIIQSFNNHFPSKVILSIKIVSIRMINKYKILWVNSFIVYIYLFIYKESINKGCDGTLIIW
jgi:hypothetical protein